MNRASQYGNLTFHDLTAAARLAVGIHMLRGLQVLGSASPKAHRISITFHARAHGIEYPAAFLSPDTSVVTVILEHRYADLRVDTDTISVTVWFRGQEHAIRIPVTAILTLSNDLDDFQVEVPKARLLATFREAYGFALATLMVFQLGSEASISELEGRALYALLPALLARVHSGVPQDLGEAVITFDTRVIGVSLPPAVGALHRSRMSFTLSRGDRDIRLDSNEAIIDCDDGAQIVVPFLAMEQIALAPLARPLALFPGPIADTLTDWTARPDKTPGAGMNLTAYGTVTAPVRFGPSSFAQALWEEGKRCLSGYIGRHSIPDLRYPDDLRQRVPLGPSTTLEVMVFDELQHNGVAFKQGPHYGVGLYHGLILALPAFATALWTRPDVAPWIGDVSRLPSPDRAGALPSGLETFAFEQVMAADEIDQDAYDRAIAAIRRQREYSTRLITAMDPVRRMAMQQSITDAVRHIWLHEIGHVVSGHLDLFDQGARPFTMVEVDDEPEEFLEPGFRQFLEFQADRFAFGTVLAMHGDAIGALSAVDARLEPRGLPSYVDQATITLIGCLLPQMIFSANLQARGRDDVAGTHPPIWMRVGDMVEQAQDRWREIGEECGAAAVSIPDILRDRMQQAVASIVRTHPMLTSLFDPFADENETASLAHLEAFSESIPRWDAVVRPHLKFYRGPDGRIAIRD